MFKEIVPDCYEDISNVQLLFQTIREKYEETRSAFMIHHLNKNSDAIFRYDGFIDGDDDQVKSYLSYYHDINPWAKIFNSFPTGMMFYSEDHISRETMMKSEIYNDFLLPIDNILGSLAISFPVQNGVHVSIHTHLGRRIADSSKEKADIHTIMSNLYRDLLPVIRFHHRIAGQQLDLILMDQAVTHKNICWIMIDLKGQIECFPAAARAMLHEDDGIFAKGHFLQFSDNMAQKTFRTLLGQLAVHSHLSGMPAPFLAHRPSMKRPYIVEVFPLPPTNSLFLNWKNWIVVAITDPEHVRLFPEARLQAAFGLTSSELRILDLLAKGRGLAEIADLLKLSKHTVRQHVKNIYSKTDTHRQGELIALVNRISG